MEIARAARETGFQVVVVAHEGETDPEIVREAHVCEWVKLGQLGSVIRHLKNYRVKKAIMAGTIAKRKMFQGIRPDLKGLTLMAKLKIFHDDAILRAVAEELKEAGVEIVSSTFLLPNLLAQEGLLTKRGPNKAQLMDIQVGYRVAKEVGRLDIGQTVVVKDRVVVAVEAIEGTDEAIRRGGRLAPGAIVVKVSKPQQDLRFDLPTVGPNTILVMKESKLAGLCIEAQRTLIMERERMIELADREGLFVLSRGEI